MRLVFACIIGTIILTAPDASAQTPSDAPPQVERVSRATIAYEDSLWMRYENEVMWRTDQVFNAPPDQIDANIAGARNALAAERARLAALPPPNLHDRDIDLTFIGNALLERRLRRLNSHETALNVASAMLDAQNAGDCVAMETRARELDRIREQTRSIGLNDGQRLHEALATFGGLPHPGIPVAIDPPLPPEARGLVKLTEALSRALRCPLIGHDVRVELIARIQADGRIEASIASISDSSLRGALSQRLITARFQPVSLLRNSPLVDRPVRLNFSGQRLSVVP